MVARSQSCSKGRDDTSTGHCRGLSSDHDFKVFLCGAGDTEVTLEVTLEGGARGSDGAEAQVTLR